MSWFKKSQEDESLATPGGESKSDSLTEAEKTQREVFICTFSMIAHMAGADGVVTRVEAAAVDKFIKNVLHLDEDRRKFAIQIFNKARKSEATFESFAQRYKELLKDRPEMFEWMADVLLRVSLADEVFTEPEAEILGRACKIFALSTNRYERILAKYQSKNPNAHYKLLHSEPEDSMDLITKRYNDLLEKYDPEKVIQSGMPEEFINLAKEQLEKIKQAYLFVIKEREGENPREEA
jgi:DnaJ like chaperone protein